jgi:hypothetical protein
VRLPEEAKVLPEAGVVCPEAAMSLLVVEVTKGDCLKMRMFWLKMATVLSSEMDLAESGIINTFLVDHF